MKDYSIRDAYHSLKSHMQKIADLRYASAVLQWDQETYLPPAGAFYRGRQLATLNETAHELFVSDKTGQLIEKLLHRDELSPVEKMNASLIAEDYKKQKKYTAEFVRKITECTHRCFHSWLASRKENNFRLFQHDLEELVQLKKEEAEIIGYRDHPYDALLNEHEKGATVSETDRLFRDIKGPFRDLLNRIEGCRQPDHSFIHRHYPKQQQWEFGIRLLKELGFDFEAGRQDISEHPFTVNFNSRDVRITTRIDENNLQSMTWSCLHELGHAFYEQGLPETEYGLPAGEPASFSIHESQSRFWENHIGRSFCFWEEYLPVLKEFFPSQLEDIDLLRFHRAINRVEPSLIRTEADELTYHFHILVRYEIEKGLMDGTLAVSDIPSAWNEQYKRYLGLTVPDDRRGCLQDVHWSHGSFGYFPTYSRGSFYAAQFFSNAQEAIPDWCDQIHNGPPRKILEWLSDTIYRHGRTREGKALCLAISGKELDPQYFLDYILDKYNTIYQF